jgi:hypothetical protein
MGKVIDNVNVGNVASIVCFHILQCKMDAGSRALLSLCLSLAYICSLVGQKLAVMLEWALAVTSFRSRVAEGIRVTLSEDCKCLTHFSETGGLSPHSHGTCPQEMLCSYKRPRLLTCDSESPTRRAPLSSVECRCEY